MLKHINPNLARMKNNHTLIALITILTVVNNVSAQSHINVYALLCNHQHNQAGVEQAMFGWKLSSRQQGQTQTAYQIIVSSDEKIISANKGDIGCTTDFR